MIPQQPFWTARGRHVFFIVSGIVLMLVGSLANIGLVRTIGILLLVFPAVTLLSSRLHRPRPGRGP